MPHYYAGSATPIQLDEAPNDIGVRFEHADAPKMARRAVREIATKMARTRGSASPASHFGRFMLLHESGASTAPVAAVVNALSKSLASRVARTMPVFIERQSQLKLVATDQILVKFKPGASPARRRKLLDGLGLQLVGHSEFDARRQTLVPTSVVRSSRTLDLANQLVAADDVIEFAAPNFLAQMRKASVNDPKFPAQWHLDNRGQGKGIALQDARAIGAWNLVGGGLRSIVIAIIDDGVDLDHPDLKDNIWKNPAARAKDRHGRDFVDDSDPNNPRPKVFNAPFDDTDRNDIHGTPCAGVAAAVGNNGRGVAGMAWNCRLMAVKIMGGEALAPHDRIADAIRYAATHADVLSCSWNVPPSPDIESALTYAVTRGRSGRGSVVCVCTGNEHASRIAFPSSDDHVVAVGACNDRGRHSAYSNRGQGLTVVAPSDDDGSRRQGITTTDVSLRGKGYSAGAYCSDFGGTSSATPLVAGVAALVLSAKRSLRWDEVRDVLTSTADKIDPSGGNYRSGHSLKYGFGRVNAEAAVAKAKGHRASRVRKAAKKR
jgi:subtilisin family serine protease